MSIDLPHTLEPGDDLVFYIDGIGRVEGIVLRKLREHGYAVAFRTTARKQDKIADQLTWLVNKDCLGLTDERTAERRPGGGQVTVSFGRVSVPCTVADISVFGVALKSTGGRPLIGAAVKVGGRSGFCVRYIEGGFAVDFRVPQVAEA